MVRDPPEESEVSGELAALRVGEEDDPTAASEGVLRREAGTALKMGAGGAETEVLVQPCNGGANAGEREAPREVDGGASALVDATALPFIALDDFFPMILQNLVAGIFLWVCRKERGKIKASFSYNFACCLTAGHCVSADGPGHEMEPTKRYGPI